MRQGTLRGAVLLLAAVLTVCGTGATPAVWGQSADQTAPAAVAQSVTQSLSRVLTSGRQPESFVMVTPKMGYLLTTANTLWSTTDGGRQWKRVRAFPWVLTLTATNHQIWVQTPRRLWVRTQGGEHWASRPLPRGDAQAAQFNPAQVGFVNRRDGWVVTTQGMAAGAETIQLWATRTGGRAWAGVSTQGLPYQGSKAFAFRTPQDGWMFGMDALRPGVVQFFQTHSGGVQWSPDSLTLPATFRHRYILFTGLHQAGHTDGILVVATPDSNDLVSWTIYHQTAAGSWQHGAIQTVPAANQNPTITWRGATAWVVNGSQLWRGKDWGRRWQLIQQWAQPVEKKPIVALTWTGIRRSVGYAIVGQELFVSRNQGTQWVHAQ